jgi:uncharacterized membrane protein YhhN
VHGRPIWGLSAWTGFICALFAFSLLAHGELSVGVVTMLGALLLFGCAALLHRGQH